MENTKIPYRFTSDPEHLMACLDKNCRSVLVALIRLSRHYHTEDGVFFRTNKDLEAEAGLAKDTLKHALDAMHIAGVITVYPQKQGQGVRQESCKYRVNHETFMEYEKYDIDDCIKNPDLKIKTTPVEIKAPLNVVFTNP